MKSDESLAIRYLHEIVSKRMEPLYKAFKIPTPNSNAPSPSPAPSLSETCCSDRKMLTVDEEAIVKRSAELIRAWLRTNCIGEVPRAHIALLATIVEDGWISPNHASGSKP